MRFGAILITSALVLISGCSTDRRYTPTTHDRMVDAAIAALSEEAHVKPDQIEKTEKDDCGRITTLRAHYNEYSDIKVSVNSTDDNKGKPPELQVEIITPQAKVAKTDIIFTRHKEWEQRIHELVKLKLQARKHGEESKPTSLPATVPAPPEPKPKS